MFRGSAAPPTQKGKASALLDFSPFFGVLYIYIYMTTLFNKKLS